MFNFLRGNSNTTKDLQGVGDPIAEPVANTIVEPVANTIVEPVAMTASNNQSNKTAVIEEQQVANSVSEQAPGGSSSTSQTATAPATASSNEELKQEMKQEVKQKSTPEELPKAVAAEPSVTKEATATSSVTEAQAQTAKVIGKSDNKAKGSKTLDPKSKKVKGKDNSRKRDVSKNSKKRADDVEEKKTSPTTAASATASSNVIEQETSSVDVHASCKKAISSLNEEIQHWKLTVGKISKETQATNNLSAELKLAAIKGVCDQAEKEGMKFTKLHEQESKKLFKRGRLPKNQLQHKQDSTTPTASTQVVNNSQSPNQPQRQQPQQQRRLPQPGQQSQQGGQRRPVLHPGGHQQANYSNRVLKSVLGVQQHQHYNPQQTQEYRTNRMSGGPPRMVPQWSNNNQTPMNQMFKQSSSVNQMTPSRPRFNSNQFHPHHHPGRSPHQQFNTSDNSYSHNKAMVPQPQHSPVNPLSMNNFLSSAAESDHPVCVRIREELRMANDAESLGKLIKKAEAHKIQDLADRGRRKLEKLQQKILE